MAITVCLRKIVQREGGSLPPCLATKLLHKMQPLYQMFLLLLCDLLDPLFMNDFLSSLIAKTIPKALRIFLYPPQGQYFSIWPF